MIQTIIHVTVVLAHKQERKETNKKTEFESKRRKQNAKNAKKNKIRFLFFLQNKKQRGSGDVVSAQKRKTFFVAKKNVLGRDGTAWTA